VFEPVVLRDEVAVPELVVVRLGARTLDDDLLLRSVSECFGRWGIWGFSVLEVPHGDIDELVRSRPIVGARRQFMVAKGASLIDAGFPRLPTLDSPHWTVVLASATTVQFERVRGHFTGPVDNPAYRPPHG
jgi:hypothetical protein